MLLYIKILFKFIVKKLNSLAICKKCVAGKYVLYNDKTICDSCNTDATVQTIYGNYCLVGSDCDPSCKKCADFQKCQVCNDGYYLLPNIKRCLPCPSSCTKCTSFEVCTHCQIDNYLLGTVCTPCGGCEGTNEEGQSNASNIFFEFLFGTMFSANLVFGG